jgi:hypothetical protein
MTIVLDNPRTDSVTGESGGVMDVQLLHDIMAMFLDGFDINSEFRRHFLVGFAFGNQLEHFQLT